MEDTTMEYTLTFERIDAIGKDDFIQTLLEVHFKVNTNNTVKVHATLYIDDSQNLGRQRYGIDGRLYRRDNFCIIKALDSLMDSLADTRHDWLDDILDTAQRIALDKLVNHIVGLSYIQSEINSL